MKFSSARFARGFAVLCLSTLALSLAASSLVLGNNFYLRRQSPGTEEGMPLRAPDAFTIPDTTGATPSSWVTSAEATLTGFSGSRTAVLFDGQNYSIVKNGSDTGGTTATVEPGDKLAIRMQAAASVSTASSAVLDVAGSWTRWTLTTTPPPNAFSFTAVGNAPFNTYYTSNTVTLAGFSGSLTATLSGASNYSIIKNGSDTGATSTTVAAGNTVAIRMQSAGASNTTRTATLSIATTSASWDLATVSALADCKAWYTAGSTTDGSYLIDPDGAGPNAPFSATCLMTADGGGWTYAGRYYGQAAQERSYLPSNGLQFNQVRSVRVTGPGICIWGGVTCCVAAWVRFFPAGEYGANACGSTIIGTTSATRGNYTIYLSDCEASCRCESCGGTNDNSGWFESDIWVR